MPTPVRRAIAGLAGLAQQLAQGHPHFVDQAQPQAVGRCAQRGGQLGLQVFKPAGQELPPPRFSGFRGCAPGASGRHQIGRQSRVG